LPVLPMNRWLLSSTLNNLYQPAKSGRMKTAEEAVSFLKDGAAFFYSLTGICINLKQTGERFLNCIVKKDGQEVFTSGGKWLYPLFELEDFLENKKIDPADLILEDKIIGRGAAVLIARLGIRKCHGRLVSEKALPVLEEYGVACTWDSLVPAIDCRTEVVLTDAMSLEEAYRELSLRAGRSL
jgi:hypothetical protein